MIRRLLLFGTFIGLGGGNNMTAPSKSLTWTDWEATYGQRKVTERSVRSLWGLPERVFTKISFEPNSGCWLWVANQQYGYGIVKFGRKQVLAHRLVYSLMKGGIPEGLTLDHLCRVRCCVNPAHLEPVTNVENIRRGMSPFSVNGRKTHCIHGHPLTPGNLKKSRADGRVCLTCSRKHAMTSYARRKKVVA